MLNNYIFFYLKMRNLLQRDLKEQVVFLKNEFEFKEQNTS